MADYRERAIYWCHHNGHADIGDDLTQVMDMKNGTQGRLSDIMWSAEAWTIEPAPSKADLDALDGATVDAWIADRTKDAESDPTNWPIAMKALALATLDGLNAIISGAVTEEITLAQWKSRIKDRL